LSSDPLQTRPRTAATVVGDNHQSRRKARPGLEIACLTDVGRQRSNNEDAFLYWEPDSEDEFRSRGRLAIIADGMGGYEGGQEASRLAVETVQSIYETSGINDPQATLLHAFSLAHSRIQGFADEHPEFHGMGTTCTAIAILGRQLCYAHIGDSRLYHLRSGVTNRLTRDHSYVGRLVETGIVRSEDAESHPQRHILTAALGAGRDPVPDTLPQPFTLETDDTLLLCTDGLWGVVAERELASAVENKPLIESSAALVQLALNRGGPDNITVLLMRVSG
jgi:PPM family protein phosphatase